jgi:hypothetical protein
MMNFLRNVDLDQVKDQLTELKGQVQDLHFRKPWTNGSETSPAAFMAVGAALALVGVALYKNRSQVASFCANCGIDIKDKWESSGLKEKAGQMMDKVRNGAQEVKSPAERYHPT